MSTKFPKKEYIDKAMQNKLSFYLLTKENLDLNFTEDLKDSDFGIGMNVIDDRAYFSFHNGWVTLQFSISWNTPLKYRFKWGNNLWSDWKDV